MEQSAIMQKQNGILLVEDSEDDVALFRRACSQEGIAIPLTHVGNAAEAMRLLERASAQPDSQSALPRIVLTDLKMPGPSGFDLLKFLQCRPALRTVTTLAWSDSGRESDARKACELGAQDFFFKPAEPENWRRLILAVEQYYDS